MKQPMKTNLLGRLSVLASRLVLSASSLVLAGSLGGCSGAYWGNLIVLGISFGIFYGTLSLGRTAPTRTSSEGAISQSTAPAAPGSSSAMVHSVPPPANT